MVQSQTLKGPKVSSPIVPIVCPPIFSSNFNSSSDIFDFQPQKRLGTVLLCECTQLLTMAVNVVLYSHGVEYLNFWYNVPDLGGYKCEIEGA